MDFPKANFPKIDYSKLDFLQEKQQPEEKTTVSSILAGEGRKSPFLYAGIAGLLVVCGIGAYKYKNRGAMSTSLYLIQLRVAAQGAAIGCMTLGMVYQMVTTYFPTKTDS